VNLSPEKSKLLLHVCCAPDATVAAERLGELYEITLFFENSSLDSEEEFSRRYADLPTVAERLGAKILEAPYDPDAWAEAVKGLEDEPEGGARCLACFRFRLARTAEAAAREGFDFFATTLTVSPHKNAAAINQTGNDVAASAAYLDSDFKKKDGFKRSVELSKALCLYRQNYCGCKYSRMKDKDAPVKPVWLRPAAE